jgi:hypothetical protein
MLGLCIAVQGCRLSPREVDRCIEEWLQIFQQNMETMTNEEFQRCEFHEANVS